MFENNGVSFRLFQEFLPRNLEGSRPRTRDRLPRIEHHALPTVAQGFRPEGSSIALSPGSPRRDTFAAAALIPLRPSDTLVEVRLSHPPGCLPFPRPLARFRRLVSRSGTRAWAAAGCSLEVATGFAEAAASIVQTLKEVKQA